MKDDPIITEIRRIRHELSKTFGHDPTALVKFLQEQEKQHSERIIHSPCIPQDNQKAA
jgi:adenylosuccinate lyase